LGEGPFHAEQVAQVELLGQRPPGFADLLLADHDLDAARPVHDLARLVLARQGAPGPALDRPARPVPDVEDMELALGAAGDASARGFAALGRLGVRVQGADLLNGHVLVEALAPRVDAQLLNRPELVESAGLVNVRGVCHGRPLSYWRISARCPLN